MQRRFFLAGLVGAATLLTTPALARPTLDGALATPTIARPGTAMRIANVMDETWEFRWQGRADEAMRARFSEIARDRREGVAYTMDSELLAILAGMAARTGEGDFFLTSGYRTPRTNAKLPGAASRSFHMRGQALDLIPRSMALAEFHAALNPLTYGGLGYYPNSGFVHVDTGPFRRWGGGPGESAADGFEGRYQDIGPDGTMTLSSKGRKKKVIQMPAEAIEEPFQLYDTFRTIPAFPFM